MAPKRHGGKARKPTMAKAKRMVTKQRKAKAKKNMDTYFLKTKNIVTLTPGQGAVVSNYLYNVWTLDPGTTTYPGDFLRNAEFNLWKLQYDKFRVNSVKITVTPKANVLDQANGNNNDGKFNVTGDGLVHTCIDRDGQAPSSKALISRYPSYRKYSILKPFTRSYAIKYPTGIWLDCDNPAGFGMAKELGLTGGVTIYAENILEDNFEILNEPWATVVVEHNIVFQGKTSNSLSGVYNEALELVGVTINRIDNALILPQTPVTMVTGTLDNDTKTRLDTVDLSGANVTEVSVDDLGRD
jgi:hypothetical protein